MAKRNLQLDKLPSNNLTTSNKKEGSIITGGVKKRRGGGLAREVRNIGNSLFEEIVMPAIKSAVVDFFSNGVNMMMFGSDSRPRRGQPRSYNKQYRNQGRGSTRQRSANRNISRTETVFEDVFFERRDDAKAVLGRMMELIADYGMATIGDLYSLVGLGTNITHEGWGWDDLSRVRVHYSNAGYVIEFPDPEYFN